MREVDVRMGLCVVEKVAIGGVIEKYKGKRITAEQSARRLQERELAGLHDEYHVTTHGTTTFFDGTHTFFHERYANNLCVPNCSYLIIRLATTWRQANCDVSRDHVHIA